MEGGENLPKDSTASIYRLRNVALDSEDNKIETIFLVFGVDMPGKPSDYIEFKQIKDTKKEKTTNKILEHKTDLKL